MCARTKTSYGCGCIFKDTNRCDTVGCTDLSRLHFQKGFDCPRCKEAGEAGVRGREGKGRYAQQIERARRKRQSSSDSTEDYTTANPADGLCTSNSPEISSLASPWVPGEAERRKWGTLHRKKADEAWLSEHEDRLSTAQDRMEGLSVSRSPKGSSKSRRSDRQVTTDPHTPTKPIEIIMRKTHGNQHSHRHPSSRRQYPQTSDDSLADSMPSYRSTYLVQSPNGSQHAYSGKGHEYSFYTTSPAYSKSSSKQYSSMHHSRPPVYMQPPYWYDDTVPTYDYYSPHGSKSHRGSGRHHAQLEQISPHYVRYRTAH